MTLFFSWTLWSTHRTAQDGSRSICKKEKRKEVQFVIVQKCESQCDENKWLGLLTLPTWLLFSVSGPLMISVKVLNNEISHCVLSARSFLNHIIFFWPFLYCDFLYCDADCRSQRKQV